MADSAMAGAEDVRGLRLPHRNLLAYWFLQSLVLGPLFFVLFLPRLFKYRSLRYHLREDGVAAEWGILFRHEISLGYGRIQDIHLASNLLERWLGLARIQVQTASGSAKAEMTIEGLPDFEDLRDRLYSRMRGAGRATDEGSSALVALPAASLDAIADAVQAAAAELRALRSRLADAGPDDAADA
jgi:putative membrane protein